jgi:hypothetical protein
VIRFDVHPVEVMTVPGFSTSVRAVCPAAPERKHGHHS